MSDWNPEPADLSGRTVLITGGNSGIGREAARTLARRGARTVIACRDLRKGESAAHDIRAGDRHADVELLALDLADLAAVAGAAEEYQQRFGPLDVLVNNAGVMALPYRTTADGFEMQLGTNHLGHFALTGRLLPALLRAPSPRVVTVSSGMHKLGRIDFANLDGSRGYAKWPAYAQSKLANLLFAFELQRRAVAGAAALISVAAHPGYAHTNLQRTGPQMAGRRLLTSAWDRVSAVAGQSAAVGSLPTVAAAAAPDIRGGDYIGPDGPFELRGAPVRVRATRAARDPETAARLWEVSSRLTGVDYDFGV